MSEEQSLIVRGNAPVLTAFPRYRVRLVMPRILGIMSRHWKLILFAFATTMAGAGTAAALIPNQYTSNLKLLVRHERVDAVVTTSNDVKTTSPETVSDEELDSEIELIRSQDLMERLVLQFNLQKTKPHFWTAQLEQWRPTTEPERIAKAVARLKSDLVVEQVKKSSFIAISYTSPDPELSAQLLNALAEYYLAKHTIVHRPTGEFQFFQEQAERYRERLASAEKTLTDFNRDPEAVAAEIGRNMALQKVSDLEYSLRQTRATIAATMERITALQAQLASTAPRLSTQIKKADNTSLLSQLKGTLLNLEIQRTELLTKYEPTYVAVQQVETQIAQTRAAIEHETEAPAQENTTDQNPTYQWIASELAKAKADLPTLIANADATERAMTVYRGKIGTLDQKGRVQQDLNRTVKTEEENYLLYLKKQEEARISDQLDSSRISNVVIVDAANIPALPSSSHMLIALLGIPLGLLVGIGAAFVFDAFDPAFRDADEVWDVLKLPVLASLPEQGRELIRNPALAER